MYSGQDSDHLPGAMLPSMEHHHQPIPLKSGFSNDSKTVDADRCGCIFKPLRAPLVLMQVFGLAHNLDWIKSSDHSKSPWSLSKVYSLIVAIIILQNPLRFFTCYDQSDFGGFQGFFLLKIIFHLWYSINMINVILMFKLFHDADKMKRFYALYDDARKLFDVGSTTFINRKVILVMTVALFGFLVNVVGYIFSLFSTPEFFYLFAGSLTPFHRWNWAVNSVPLKLLFCVNHIFNTAVWIFPIMLLLIVCFLIVNTEVTFNNRMKSCLLEDGTFTGDLATQRVHYLRICDIIEVANEMFQNFFGFNIAILMVNACLGVYALANSTWLTTNIYTAAFVLFWVAGALLCLLILSYGAGIINDKAYEFIGVLHRIRRVDFSRNDDFELNMFLSKLNGPPIGFSAFDLFTIDKPSIMTVFGMVLSYLLFMVELSNGNSGSSSCVQSAINATTNATSL